jgi:hypothetical protein
MSELFFVIKVFLFTVVVMAVMQIKVGEQSLEQRSSHWLRTSSLVDVLNSVSVGASKALNDGYHYIKNSMNAKLGFNDSKDDSEKSASHQSRAKTGKDRESASAPILKSVKFVHESQI